MCGPRESLALCHVFFFLHTHVNHRVVWHNISTQCFSMCVLFSLRFHGFGAAHCERLRVGMCVLSSSSLVCFCHCWVMFVMRFSLGVATNKCSDGGHDLQRHNEANQFV